MVLHIVLHVSPSEAQDQGKPCMDRFSHGKEDFVLNTDESVKEGATFLSSPQVSRAEDCVRACCNDPNCNLALMEHGQDPKSITACFIFNCLYKQTKVCRFVRKKGFSNYLLKSVFKDYLEQKISGKRKSSYNYVEMLSLLYSSVSLVNSGFLYIVDTCF